jgi:Potential Queuosine, Q, salvage protein family
VVITDAIRDGCAWVADRATSVRLMPGAIGSYAESVACARVEPPSGLSVPTTEAEREATAAFWLTLDAINFGSGWFPTLRKRSQPTGYRTIAAGLRRRFDWQGAWTASQLAKIEVDELALVLDQDPAHELIELFVGSLRDLGGRLVDGYGGSFTALVDEARGSAVALVTRLAAWDSFTDVSAYAGREIAFLKRAQIAAADLHRAGVARFGDTAQLTLFADNLVPHVLRLDGVLEFEPALVRRIDRGELIEHGSSEEVEIRACAVHAVELIVAAARHAGLAVSAAQIDETLWNRGQGAAYKSVPRHRSRTTAY